ncbi:MAG: hypothetical protein AB7U73_22775 [Pirellulales bacterium]
MNILVVDIGGTNVKVWKTGEREKCKIPSGKELTPKKLFEAVKECVGDWQVDRVSMGYPGDVLNGRPSAEAYNLGPGWVEYDYPSAFNCPVKIMNDACMQALGSYEGGRMLYIGLGTSMGTTLIVDGVIVPLALGHLKFFRGETFEHYLSRKGLELHGLKRWRRAAIEAAHVLKPAFLVDYVVLGGGNAKKLDDLPEGIRRGSNENAYFGGLKMWPAEEPAESTNGLSVVPAVEIETQRVQAM